jgi:16S rRNA C967 or C1407 C5-methylase (RsmB/RsmF family)
MSTIEDFINAYSPQYGLATRELIQALLAHDEKVALLNPFIPKTLLEPITKLGTAHVICGFTYWLLPKDAAPQIINNLVSHYFLDKSSLLAPLLLPMKPNMHILDMCSAPGGKLLVLIFRLFSQVSYVANDISSARLMRLKKVINSYIPENLRNNIKISSKNGSFFALKTPQKFDAVLLDAPCSSEQHALKNASLLKKFKGLRKNLAQRQYSLLCSALLAVKPGGFVMYATCSINQHENQDVIKKLLKKKSDLCQLIQLEPGLGQPNAYGVSILPHEDHAGPAFLSLLMRL